MIVLCGEISRSKHNSSKDSNQSNHNNRRHNKDDICVTKAAARKSILIQITARAKAANGFH
jgi:hypothetical protein